MLNRNPAANRTARLLVLNICILFLLPCTGLYAQKSGSDLKIEASYRFMLSDSNLPFWFSANQWGLVHPDASYQHLAGFRLQRDLVSNPDGFNLYAGSELAGRTGDTGSTLHFRQLYLSAEYLGFRLSAGRFYDVRGITMEPLSMGSMTMSRNATPVPKIKFETKDFTNIPFTNEILQFHFQYSDGILEKNRRIESPFLHQKSLHFKVNIRKLELIMGIDHNVVWAGNHPEFGRRSRSLNDYLRVVFSRSGSPEDGAFDSEIVNRLGNTVGGYDLGFNYPVGDGMLRAYRTFFIEDRPAWQFRSPWDGLWGFGYQRNETGRFIDAILYEHMNTIRQDAIRHIPEGRANYYNHGHYQNGWAYNAHVLGNPLITYDREARRVTNSMVLAHHVALSGNPASRIEYTMLFNYSRNYGRCADRVVIGTCAVHLYEPLPDEHLVLPRRDFRQDRFSILFETNYLLSRQYPFWLNTAIALDLGEFSGTRFGLMTGIRWGISN